MATLDDPSIADPTTGELISITDVDELASALNRINRIVASMSAAQMEIRAAIAFLAQGEGQTLRVRGAKHRCRVELPDDHLEQSVLRSAWDKYPGIADQVLKVERIGLKKTEWKKWQNERGPLEFEQCKAEIKSAISPSMSIPKVTVEE